MKWLLNMRIAGKQLLLVVPLFVALIGFIFFFAIRSEEINEDSKQALYDEAFVSTAAILNADRDLYQALVAEMEMVMNADELDPEARDSLIADYEENVAQVEERVNGALVNLQDNTELYTGYVHEATGLTLEDLAASFQMDFGEWESLYDPATGEGDPVAKQTEFNEVRDEINTMTEILENYANARSAEITEGVTTSIYVTVAIVAGVILLLSGLALYLILTISRGIRYVTGISRKIAQGDLSVAVDAKRLTKDEIGQLTSTIDNEVRKAFVEIEQAREISVKKDRYQTAQVEKLLANLKKLSKGELRCDMTVDEPGEHMEDIYMMFSEISTDMHSSIDAIRRYIDEMTHHLGRLAQGDLTEEIVSEYMGDFASLKESINYIVASMNSVFSEIIVSADQVAAGTNQVSDGSQEISQGATEQASAIEQLTASVSQIAEQTKQNAVNANEANRISKGAQETAMEGNAQMKELQLAMTEINESSVNISKIIKVIDDIAFQTNILALNAAVEAARAGAHGKGFAVVADEVRSLAARSANAAGETAALIQQSMNKVEAGAVLTDATAKALDNIVSSVQRTVELVAKITEASGGQATSIAQVDKGIEQMSIVVQTNSATAEQAAAASEELSSQAQMLKDMIARFQLKTQKSESKAREARCASHTAEKARPVIALSDPEFGKY